MGLFILEKFIQAQINGGLSSSVRPAGKWGSTGGPAEPPCPCTGTLSLQSHPLPAEPPCPCNGTCKATLSLQSHPCPCKATLPPAGPSALPSWPPAVPLSPLWHHEPGSGTVSVTDTAQGRVRAPAAAARACHTNPSAEQPKAIPISCPQAPGQVLSASTEPQELFPAQGSAGLPCSCSTLQELGQTQTLPAQLTPSHQLLTKFSAFLYVSTS